jgi:plastocyanin
MFRRLLITGVAVTSLAAISACGGDSGGAETTLPPEADLVVKAVPSVRWDAESYEVAAGDVTIALVNDDAIRHTLVVLDGDTRVGGLELEVGKPGDVDSGTFRLEAGTYRIFCTVPGHQNMNSELVVTG